MNEILTCLHERKSVRVFLDQVISCEEKHEILMAAMMAPTVIPGLRASVI